MNNSYCYLFFFLCFLKISFASAAENTNFILINNRSNKIESADYRLPREEIPKHFDKLNRFLKNQKLSFEPLLLFFNEQGSDHQIVAKILLMNEAKLYLLSEDEKITYLGHSIDLNDNTLNQLKTAVANGKMIAAYWKKKNLPVSFITGEKGVVYSVSKESQNDLSIETIGLSHK